METLKVIPVTSDGKPVTALDKHILSSGIYKTGFGIPATANGKNVTIVGKSVISHGIIEIKTGSFAIKHGNPVIDIGKLVTRNGSMCKHRIYLISPCLNSIHPNSILRKAG